MIKNERQYRITRARIEEFRKTLERLETAAKTSTRHPRLRQAEIDATRSQIETMEQEVHAYDELKSGTRTVLAYASLEDLPRALIEALKGVMQGQDPDPDVDLGDLEALSGVRKFPVRVKCAALSWNVVESGLKEHVQQKHV